VGQEAAVRTTVYLNEKKSLHAATTVTFDFQSKKKDSTTKVGNIMNLEGGVGGSFLKGGLVAGLAYYGTFKLTEDHFANPPANALCARRTRSGPRSEFTLALAAHNTIYGFATVRYQWELAGRTRPKARRGTSRSSFRLSRFTFRRSAGVARLRFAREPVLDGRERRNEAPPRRD
jgi:hypothetical protein